MLCFRDSLHELLLRANQFLFYQPQFTRHSLSLMLGLLIGKFELARFCLTSEQCALSSMEAQRELLFTFNTLLPCRIQLLNQPTGTLATRTRHNPHLFSL
eukprot:m.37366 g.37366  ORF g.37366 m.37366 type:complete len:100 (-) comp9804_c0_seq1:273-572(-)